MLRRTGEQPGVRITQDLLGMSVLPPVPPMVGTSTRVRLGRDYYVRIAGNDYSIDPTVIGRFLDVPPFQRVARHPSAWGDNAEITALLT
jgi:hypothetical protein